MPVRAAHPTAGQARRLHWLLPPLGRGQTATLVLAGLLLEAVFVFGFLWPLSIWRNPEVVPDAHPLATVLGLHPAGALRFGVPVVAGFAVLALAVWAARGLHGRATWLIVLGGTAIFAATLIPINPVGAQDIYHNAADARTFVRYGDNPNVLPPNAFPDDPFYPHVVAWQDFASVYGPVWYAVSGMAVPFAGDGLWGNVIGQKVIAAWFLLGTTLLTMLVAGRIRPGAAPAAGVLVGWCPLTLFETAGNAHNDVVMVFFALAALYAVTRRWWLAVFPLLALSVAVKYVLVLLGPVLLLWMLRRHDIPRRQIMLSLALGALTGIAVYIPFFTGVETLANFQRQAGFNTSSPSALLDTIFIVRLDLDQNAALSLTKLVVSPLFFGAYGVLLWRIRRDAGLVQLVRSSFWAVFLLLAIATWWYWPWYVVFVLPLAALHPGSRIALVGGALAACSMLMYIPYFWLIAEDWVLHQTMTAMTAFTIPILLALAPRLPRRTPATEPVPALAGD